MEWTTEISLAEVYYGKKQYTYTEIPGFPIGFIFEISSKLR